MSGLTGILALARRALQAQQLGLSVTGNNIANVNTPGYTRQDLLLVSDAVRIPGVGGLGTGVSLGGIQRSRDAFADAELRRENHVLGYWTARNQFLKRVEALNNEVLAEGLTQALSDFLTSWQELSDTPEDRLARVNVVEQGESLAAAVAGTAEELRRAERTADETIEAHLTTLNATAERIASLNARIVARSGDSPHLQDERDRLIEEITLLADATVTFQPNGGATVRIGGMVLVDGPASFRLEMQQGSEPGSAARGPVWRHNGATARIAGGQIGGLIAVRDESLAGLRRDLDRFAFALAQEVNRIHRAGTDLDGRQGGDFFLLPAGADELEPAGSAAALRLAPELLENPSRLAAGTGGAPGDNRTALAVAGLRTASLESLGRASLGSFWTATSGRLGSQVREAGDRQVEHGLAVEQLLNLRDSLSGVSLDEEAAKLVAYEQAYAAAARVANVADEMAQTLLSEL